MTYLQRVLGRSSLLETLKTVALPNSLSLVNANVIKDLQLRR